MIFQNRLSDFFRSDYPDPNYEEKENTDPKDWRADPVKRAKWVTAIKAGHAKRSPGERSEAPRKGKENMGAERRKDAARKGRENMGAEGRKEATRKRLKTLGKFRPCESAACAVYAPDERFPGKYRAKEGLLCYTCLSFLHPERTRLQVRREHLIVAEIQRLLPYLQEQASEFSWDCPVPGGCSLKKPDLIYILGDFFVHFEIDEHGHKYYPCEDEDVRLAIIAADVGLPGYVLRINPDGERAMLEKVQHESGELMWRATSMFEPSMRTVADFVRTLQTPPTETVECFFFPVEDERPA